MKSIPLLPLLALLAACHAPTTHNEAKSPAMGLAESPAAHPSRGDSAPQSQALFPPSALPIENGVYQVADPQTPAACRANRVKVAAELGDGHMAVASGPEVEGRFIADPHFYWLTGVNTPELVLLLEVADGALVNETLFVPAKDPSFERWNGTRIAPGAEAEAATGIAHVVDMEAWPTRLAEYREQDVQLFAFGTAVRDAADELGVEVESGVAAVRRAAAVHTAAELQALQAAIDITQDALVDAFRIIEPGQWEFQAEAAIEGGFRKRGAIGPGFPSIVGSGPNTCFLHYRDNKRQMQAGDLVVMDVGARFGGFTADVTRTIPVSGTFTPRQLEVYQAVWDASLAGAAELKPGSTLRAAHNASAALLEERGLRQYFFHSVGHGLGLLVHDNPSSRTELVPGMVVTIEPGVYIADEELGVRIENDWLITPGGARLLSSRIPSDPAALVEFLAQVRPAK